MIEANWSEIKRVADNKSLPMQWIEVGANYHIALVDGPFILCCLLPIGVDNADTTAFEATYKSVGNKRVDVTMPAFASKTFGNKKLFARNTGFQASVTGSATTDISHTISLPWVKITGVQVVNCEALDTVNFKVFDTAAGTYSGVPNYMLNQFGFSVNMPKDYYSRESIFDADAYSGMILKIEYTSVSTKTVGFNIIMSEVK